MLGENIRKYRVARGLSQEALAQKLNIVRQTLSKWEKGLSFPDAVTLVALAQALDTSVAALLGLPEENVSADLAAELARVRDALDAQQRESEKRALAGKKQGQIIFLSFLALFAMLSGKGDALSLCAVAILVLAALILLYRSLPLLSQGELSAAETKVLKVSCRFSAALFLLLVLFCVLAERMQIDLSDRQGCFLLSALFSCVFLFCGTLAPKLPFQRHTGLRLPWTVQDSETWLLAHRLLGALALPLTLFYIGAAVWISPDLDAVGNLSLAAMLIYIGIPAFVSLCFYIKKYRHFL